MALSKAEALLLRPARPSDARPIAALSRRQVEHGLRWRYTPPRIAALVRDPDCMVLTAEQVGRLAGFAIMAFGETVGHLYLLAVSGPYQRRGIGTRLMRWLEESADVAGLACLRLEVRASNEGARRFYQRLGFRVSGQFAGYYEGREAAVVMTRSLRRLPPA